MSSYESYGAYNPGLSGSLTGGGSDIGAEVCWTNADSSVTTCVNGSTNDRGSGGISLTLRW